MSQVVTDVRLAFPGFTLEVRHAFDLSGITALFGQSGGGKSTLLRVIAGLERNAVGQVVFDGEVWQHGRSFIPPYRRGVGYMFQDARLFPHLTVAGNLAYADKRAQNVPGRFSFGDVVDALDLDALLTRRTQVLSGGERQRVAIGRTLLTRPRILLLDEPLAALDAGRKAEILPYIGKLPSAFGIPIVYVTHSLDEVIRLADRIVVLSGGRLRAAGGVTEVLERLDLAPATGRFEAGVIVTARIVAHDTSYRLTRLDHHGQTLVIPMIEAAIGGEIRLRVRARDVSLATQRPNGISMRNILAGIVAEVAEEPDTAFAETLVDIGGARLRARLTRASVADLGLVAGVPVFALIKSISFDRRSLLMLPDQGDGDEPFDPRDRHSLHERGHRPR